TRTRTSSRPAAAASPTASKQHVVRVRVRLFARYREATGQERLDVDVPEGGTVEAAWKAIIARHPDLARYRPYTLFAVGHDYVEPDHRLTADDELCLFPPVSGGSASGRAGGRPDGSAGR